MNNIFNEIKALLNSGQINKADELSCIALKKEPNNANINHLRGRVLLAKKNIEEAIIFLKNAVKLDSVNIDYLINLGYAYMEYGDFASSAQYYQKALEINQESSEVYIRLGELFHRMGNNDSAERSLKMALTFSPDSFAGWTNYGNLMREKGAIGDAINAYKKSLELQPDFPLTLNNMALCLTEQGKIEEAEIFFEKALNSTNINQKIYSNYAFTTLYNPKLNFDELYKKHIEYSEKFFSNKTHILSLSQNRIKNKKIRIGYVSADFKIHSVAYFIRPIFMNHNRDKFEIFCYSNVEKEDNVTKELKKYIQNWRDIFIVSDENAVQMIINDNIDILIDLSGNTAGNRLNIFTYKPAPIQISYLGYPFTTGLKSIDYRITDNIADPLSEDKYYSEKLVRLNQCFLCYSPLDGLPIRNNIPLDFNGYITFGSFNTLPKINDAVIKTWSEILLRVKNSRLMLKRQALDDFNTKSYIIEKFRRNGITSDRLILIGHTVVAGDHLSYYSKIDISLDTFPYNGTTTTCESLWMGVPVIALLGKHHRDRVSLTILKSIGLEELVASNTNDYINLAVTLANNKNLLRKLSLSLRNKMAQSSICDAKTFTKNLENILITLCDKK